MIDITTTGEQKETQHTAMLRNAREALDKLRGDLQTQLNSVESIRQNLAKQDADLAANQERRGELLAHLSAAQLEVNKAQAGRDLAQGTPSEQEREYLLTEARDRVNAVLTEMAGLGEADARVQSDKRDTQVLLEDASHNLSRIEERVAIAQGLFDEVEGLHREEIAGGYLEKLQEARQQRDYLKQQLLLAEDAVTQAQDALVEAVRPWPQWAEEVLHQHLEIEPDLSSRLLDVYLHYSDEIEQHSQGLVKSDPAALNALLIPCPVHTFSASGPRESQREAYRRNYKSPGRAITPDLWHFDTHLSETEQLRDRRRAEHRQQVIHELVWGNSRYPLSF